MKTADAKYRVAELAVLISLLDDARSDIEEARSENRIGQTTDDSRADAIEAINNLSDSLHDMLYAVATDFLPIEH